LRASAPNAKPAAPPPSAQLLADLEVDEVDGGLADQRRLADLGGVDRRLARGGLRAERVDEPFEDASLDQVVVDVALADRGDAVLWLVPRPAL
jgi:hypothetical protein